MLHVMLNIFTSYQFINHLNGYVLKTIK